MPPSNVTATPAPELDILACLPDDERRLILAWRNARAECKNGTPFIGAALVQGSMFIWCGQGAGKFLLR